MAGDVGPAILDRPETIEKAGVDLVEKNAEQSARPKLPAWEVRLFNDPFNKREFVARCLSEVCGKSDTESFQIMMAAHKNGMGLIGVYDFEIAELYYSSLNEMGLQVDMVKVEDE
jgi:ATP-dependent Clp protease adapter protein ClpS